APGRLPQERRIVTDIPAPRSRELQKRRLAAAAPRLGRVLPGDGTAAARRVVVGAGGTSGTAFGCGAAGSGVGNANARVAARDGEQAGRFTHPCFMVAPYESYGAVCENLNRITPGDHEKRSILVNSGAEAVENAVKIARYATGRPAVVVFDHG